MLVEVVFDCDDPGPKVSLERPHHGGRGGGHPKHRGRKTLEVTIEVIHSAPVPGLSVLGDKLGSVAVTGGAILAEETPTAAEDEEEDGDDDYEDDEGLGVIKLRVTVLETGKKLVAERSEAETQEAIKLKQDEVFCAPTV